MDGNMHISYYIHRHGTAVSTLAIVRRFFVPKYI